MTPDQLQSYIDTKHDGKKTAAAAHFGISRMQLHRYLKGEAEIPKLVELACKNRR